MAEPRAANHRPRKCQDQCRDSRQPQRHQQHLFEPLHPPAFRNGRRQKLHRAPQDDVAPPAAIEMNRDRHGDQRQGQ